MDPVAAYHDPERPAPGARPWVLVNMVASVDGATAVDGRSGLLGGDAEAGVAEVVVTDGERVEPAWLLADLHARGARTVVCEGGPGLNGQLARAGLVDEWCVTVSPRLVGGGAGLLAGPPVTSPLPLRLAHVLAEDGFLFCRWLAG